ncbi:ABC transporter ATP-binding protein [Thiobacter aerophilum]|uniref:ABC transporter ATP-binding protein n=1 Tax=Thiobacter aerophilum TaxID=3121275 RepID=A0ABV0EE67_9BURK
MSPLAASPATTVEPLVTVAARGLSRRYGAAVAVEPLDLELRRGEVLGLLGPNGAGKSTTLRMLTGNLAPSAGEIRICGIDLLAAPRAAKRHLGYCPETPPLYRELTVDEYLDFCARLHRVPSGRVHAAREQAKARCGLADMGRRLIAQLSKGYQQRVGIAQAIVHEPDVIILDEPTVGLDPHQMREIRVLIRELGTAHSVILSSHILSEVEAVCDRVLILHRGRVVFADRIEALKHFRAGHALLVSFTRPPAVEALAALPGIVAVEPLETGLFRVRLMPDAGAPQAIARAAVEGDWGLTRLCPEHTTLEEVFVELTRDVTGTKP